MKIYWTIGSIPELKHLPRREARQKWREATFRSYTSWRGLAAFIGYALLLFAGLKIVYLIFPYSSTDLKMWRELLNLIVIILCTGIYWLVMTITITDYLQKSTKPSCQ